MKKILKTIGFLVFYFVSFPSFCNDWLTRADFVDKSDGYIVEKNGDTTFGLVKFSINDKIILETKKDIVTLDPILVKKIYLHNQILVPLFLNDSTELVYSVVIDTSKKFKVYQGYEFANSMSTTSGVASNSFNVFSSKIYFRTCYAILSEEYYDAILFSNTNLKKILRKNFSDDPEVVKYLDTFKSIPFEDVPKIMEQINVILN